MVQDGLVQPKFQEQTNYYGAVKQYYNLQLGGSHVVWDDIQDCRASHEMAQ